ncbi:hypothetical protein GCM10009540_80660 [Streptomyces turgidiscabies]|nr:hypothetical protein T45_00356 [Streptomyces turgidiscabies]
MRRSDFGRYLYWSDRKIRHMARDNGLSLHRPWYPTAVTSPGEVMGVPLPQVEFAPTQGQDQNRQKIARKLLKAVGAQATVTFGEPPPVHFAQGVDQVNIAWYGEGPERDKGTLLHVRTHSTAGEQVDLVLFGSMDNLADFRRSEVLEAGWSSSAWTAVYELLQTRGTRNSSQWDDPESLAVEVLKIALAQGDRPGMDHANRPWTRGYTLGHAPQCEWFAEIFTDVVLAPARWNFQADDPLNGASRILVGAPVWVRTASPRSVVRYSRLRQNASGSPRRWQRSLFRPARSQQEG